MTVIVTEPGTVKSQGNTSLLVLTTAPADPTAPTQSELDAGVNISCFPYGQFAASGEQNTGTAPSKNCSTMERTELGRASYDFPDLEYSHDPQADDTDPANEAKTTLTPGTQVWVYERRGMPAKTTAFSDGQKLRGHHVTCGEQFLGSTGDGEFDEESVTQSFAYTGENPSPVSANSVA